MDRKVLIANLNRVFSEYNKSKKRCSEIWLTEEDFGGLYYSEKYILNVKVEKQFKINSTAEEISEILSLLDEKAKEELQYILRVAVFKTSTTIFSDVHDECIVIRRFLFTSRSKGRSSIQVFNFFVDFLFCFI